MAKFQYLLGENGTPGFWFVELNGHTCKLSHLDGLGYIAKILRYRSLDARQVIGSEPPPPSFRTGSSLLEAFMPVGKDTEDDGFDEDETNWGYEIGDTAQEKGGKSVKRIKGTKGRALPIQQVNRIIEELNAQQRAALEVGDKKRAEQLGQALIGARYYKSTTFGMHGKQRRFETEFSRMNDAIRKAIERAIAAIAKRDFPIADHFKKAVHGVRGVWSYTGTEEWELYVGDVRKQVFPVEERAASPKWGQQRPCSHPRHPNTEPGWPNRENDPEMQTIRAFAEPTGVLEDLFNDSVEASAWWYVPASATKCCHDDCNSPALRGGYCVKHGITSLE